MINILRAKPELSISDLRLLCRRGRFGRILGTLTLREYWSGTPDDTIDPVTGAPDKLARRQRYDDDVLEALRTAGRPLSHDEVAGRVGGSAQEARVALQRLTHERGDVLSHGGLRSGCPAEGHLPQDNTDNRAVMGEAHWRSARLYVAARHAPS